MEPENKKVMREQLEVLNLLGDSGNDYLFLWDLASGRVYFAGNIWQRYDLPKNEDGGCTMDDWYRIVYKNDLPALRRELKLVRQGKAARYNNEYRLVDREGNRVWVNCRGRCQLDEQGKPIALIGRVSDTALERMVDQLTGAFNATRLTEDMDRILASEIPCYLLLMGVDNLKHINLHYGRDYGSRILCMIADTLEELVGVGLRIYRVNGDCFAANLPVEDQAVVEDIYRKLCARMAEYCTLSAGVVSYTGHQDVDSSVLYQYAEETLDKAKRMGKNTLAVFSQKDYEEKLSTVELQEELRRSVQEGFSGFSVYYQPQIRTGTYELFGMEALLRYRSPARGPLSPVEFIPVLEQTGLICQVGLWTLKTAMEQCRIWRKNVGELHVSVNVSYVQLSQENIEEQVLELLSDSGLPGDALTLEVTESMQLQDYSRFNRLFYRWKQAGIEISVDDFGTGYSSLGYLKNLNIDEIKIDRCFVRGIQYSAYNYRLLSNMLELARSSQIRVCCEGVETREELAALEELGPDILQGYLFDKPLSAADFARNYIEEGTETYKSSAAVREGLRQVKWSEEQLPREFHATAETMDNIMGALDEIVYVSDPKTYELYYLNPAGRQLTGVFDYNGQKCYKVLQGKDDPCEFCTNSLLNRDRFYFWELENKKLKRHFLLKDKLIPWQGKLARLELAVDITEREVLSRSVREKLDFAENVLACAKVLAQEPDMNRATRQMLASVAEFYQSDRAYLFEPISISEGLWSNTCEWCREGVAPEQANQQRVPAMGMQRWMDLFEKDTSVIVPNVEELRDADPSEYKRLHSQGVSRLIATPIHSEGKLVGFLGVDNPRHCVRDDSMIRTLSLFVVDRFSKNETEERLGELLDLHYRDVLKDTNVGLWFIRMGPNANRREMFADETMRRVLGIEGALSPQKCYEHWYSRVHESYRAYVNQAVEQMLYSDRPVELEYPWQHPTRGEVVVRCTGIRTADTDHMICLEGYHRIVSDIERPQFLPSPAKSEVFEFCERKKAAFFHTDRTLLAGEEKHEENFPECWLREKIVHPHFAEKFAALFRNVPQNKDVDGMELLMRTKQGTYEWFQLSTRHMGEEEPYSDTILVLLDTANRERVLQLENMRIREFYQASLSEAIAYAEVDLESDTLKSAGGLWAGYEQKFSGSGKSLLRFMEEAAASDVRIGQNMKNLEKADSWKALLAGDAVTRRFRYQRRIDGEWRWTELVAHSFREQCTETSYALLYLKDIDAQVRKEQAQKEAANRDPLTGVLNRNAFESAVREYMEAPEGQRRGAMILLDIDNFKNVNDRLGHPEGDNVLRYVTKLLTATFRQQDVIGRLGGDEFVVFVQGAITREILDQRMERFNAALGAYPKTPISCSAGILFVRSEGFSYTRAVLLSDKALYDSKQKGKHRHTYADPNGTGSRQG